MSQFKFELGARVKDTLTGLKGPIVYRVEYLTGCNQYGIFTGLDKDGNIRKDVQFDENRLEPIDKAPYKLPTPKVKEVEKSKPGGPNTIISSPTH